MKIINDGTAVEAKDETGKTDTSKEIKEEKKIDTPNRDEKLDVTKDYNGYNDETNESDGTKDKEKGENGADASAGDGLDTDGKPEGEESRNEATSKKKNAGNYLDRLSKA